MKKRLFAIFGLVVLAFGLLALFFISFYQVNIDNPEVIKRVSSSMSANVLKGDAIKDKALSERQYIPFFGSSELSRIGPFHPSVLAEKHDRGYRPFLPGTPGAQSLSQYMMIRSAGGDLKNKKVVFTTSSQWSVRDGVKIDYFDTRYSELQTYDWLFSLKKVMSVDRYLARGLLTFSRVKENDTLTGILQTIKEGKLPLPESLDQLHSQWNMLKRGDEILSDIGLKDRQQKIDHESKRLPDHYQETELSILADKIGRQETTNNPFGSKNDSYTHRIRSHEPELKQSQRDWDYRLSPEFSDFQLILDQLAKSHNEVLFIIPPVNEKWSDYTGLSQEMLQGFAKKIKFQLNSQGFNRIVDFVNQAGASYLMEDTIHSGWKDWLATDQQIRPLLEENQLPSRYHPDDAFFSKA